MLKKIISAVICLMLSACAAVLILPGFFSLESRVVLSGSMEPVCPVGSLLLICPCSAADIAAGDILTYALADGTYVTHRVYEEVPDQEAFVTKGDANACPDAELVPYQAIVGRPILIIPLLGYLLVFLQSPVGLACLCFFLAAIFLLSHKDPRSDKGSGGQSTQNWKGSVKEP